MPLKIGAHVRPFAVPGHSPATGTSEPSERNIQWGEAASPTRSAVSTASPARHTVTKAVTRHTTDLGELEVRAFWLDFHLHWLF